MTTSLQTERYHEQVRRWPRSGRQIMAQYDAATVVVYQAYRPSIGAFAVQHQRFGGGFSFERMSWIKTNFLWMMFRSGWGTKPDQEVTLAIWLHRAGFDALLREAVISHYTPALDGDPAAWRAAVAASSVRLQWDPDHDLDGGRVERRALQLGIRGDVLRSFADAWIERIEDISDFVATQRAHIHAGRLDQIETPSEAVYPVDDRELATRLRITHED